MPYKDPDKERRADRKRYLANPNKYRERSKARYAANRETMRKRAKARYAANSKKECGERKKRYAADPDKCRESNRVWRLVHANYDKKYRTANKEKRSQYNKKWRAANVAKAREQCRLRRVRKAGVAGSSPSTEQEAIYKKQHELCANPNCGVLLSTIHGLPNSRQWDHIYPLKPKNSDAFRGTNHIENGWWLCRTCNLAKHRMDPIAWALREGFLLPNNGPKMFSKRRRRAQRAL